MPSQNGCVVSETSGLGLGLGLGLGFGFGFDFLVLLMIAACGSGDDGADITVPEGATFCSVFQGEYRAALDGAVPATDERFGERAATIAAWAEILWGLAPDEVSDDAMANLQYHEAQLDRVSAAEHIAGSNDMHAWAQANC